MKMVLWKPGRAFMIMNGYLIKKFVMTNCQVQALVLKNSQITEQNQPMHIGVKVTVQATLQLIWNCDETKSDDQTPI